MIRVLVAEDSPTVRELLVRLLDDDAGIEVVGVAKDGAEAVRLAEALRPDLVTMDIKMPVLDGFVATKEIMIRAPTPIIIVSSAAGADVELALHAVRAGALTVLPTPEGPWSPGHEAGRRQLIETVKAMSQVKVVRRWRERSHPPPAGEGAPERSRLVVIAASTGGPAALQRILLDLPRDFPAPILVVQHIAHGFLEGLRHWLAASCDLRVRLASDRAPLGPGTVYLAPDERHLGVDAEERIALSDAGPVGGFRPSATHLFESAARSYGAATTAVILTGMGRDGVSGLGTVREHGGTVIAQDEASCVVFGMPQEAVRAGVTTAVLPLSQIARRLMELTAGDGGR